MGGFLSGIASLGQKIGGALNSPKGKGISDLVGRAGNSLAVAGGDQGAYEPQQGGLGGIRKDVQDISHSPMQVAPEHALPPIGVGVPVGTPPRLPFQPRPMPSFSPVNPLIPAGANGPTSY